MSFREALFTSASLAEARSGQQVTRDRQADRTDSHPDRHMTPAARSVHVFGNYLLVLSVILLVAPNSLLQLLGLPPTTEVWIRVVGMLVAFLSIYYRTAARANLTPFFVATVLVRGTVPIFLLGFILAGWVGWPLLIFGGIDAAGAAWTWQALRRAA
jgi:hypothetical protein